MRNQFLAIVAILGLLAGCSAEHGEVGGREQLPSGGGVPTNAARAPQTATALGPVSDQAGAEPAVGESPPDEATVEAGAVTRPASTVVTQALAATPGGQAVRGEGLTSYKAEARYWIGVYFPGQEAMAYRVASCETGGTFNPGAVGLAGEQGIYQIRSEFWGSVPPDIAGQTAMAASIVARYGWSPWACA